MAFNLADYLDTAKTRIDQWVRDFDQIGYDPAPLTVEQVKALKIGSVCYIVSKAGVRLGMLAGRTERTSSEWRKALCGDASICFVGSGPDSKFKVKNLNKTFALFRAVQ